jgi:transcriptional regulator with XRE-family HTH domain
MIIGDRLRAIRESRKLSQGDIQAQTGLLRCSISRVENGRTIPSLVTLEKMALALEVHLYQVLYEGDQPPPPLIKDRAEGEWGTWGKSARCFRKRTDCLSRMDQAHRLAKKLAKRRRR